MADFARAVAMIIGAQLFGPDNPILVVADRPSYFTTVMVPSCACSSILPEEARMSPSMV
jgi:hypothetical protein